MTQTTGHHLRNRFTAESIGTASPARVVIMAYERLDRDLTGAAEAIATKDFATANSLLGHAQDLVHELLLMLDQDAWEHAPALASIYRFVVELMTRANIHKSVADVTTARTLLADLGSAFEQAAVIAHASPQADEHPAPFADTAAPGLSATTSPHRVWIRT